MAEGKNTVYAALQAVQRELKAPKGQYNSFGKYKYRSAEDIIEAVKPLLNENGLVLQMSDEILQIGDRFYVKATVCVIDTVTGSSVSTHAFAREDLQKKGMDGAQITGTASSYARKYALNGLFAIDDTKDADTNEYRNQQSAAQASQTLPQATQSANGSNNTQNPAKAATHEFNEKMRSLHLSREKVKELCQKHYGTTNFLDLTAGQIKNFTSHLESWSMGVA